ncbi:MAG: ankyrin repeat domain-containing protein [Alphaproteobacteria bacterium]|nr:ankyrin repeat domain-containing protein [Alphaproteobacteria bacterium]
MKRQQDKEKGCQLIEELRKKAGNCDIALCRRLINEGADVRMKDWLNDTALALAAEEGHADIIRPLIDAGADIDMQMGDNRWTALIEAAWRGHTATVLTLIHCGAKLDIQEKSGGWTALMLATMNNHTNIVQALIAAGADTTLKDKKKRTAYDIATQHDYHAPAEILRIQHVKQTFSAAAKAGTPRARKIWRAPKT